MSIVLMRGSEGAIQAKREATKMEAAVAKIIERHQARDREAYSGEAQPAREARQIQRLQREAAQIRKSLERHREDRKGPNNSVRQSNRTDNESAKMATNKGVIQGYTAVAAVDDKHQIILEAQAHGVGTEQELLEPMVGALSRLRQPSRPGRARLPSETPLHRV